MMETAFQMKVRYIYHHLKFFWGFREGVKKSLFYGQADRKGGEGGSVLTVSLTVK